MRIVEVIHNLLKCPCSMLVDRNLEEIVLENLKDKVEVGFTAVNNKLLDKIVSKWINDKFVKVRIDFVKDGFEVGQTELVARNKVFVDFFLKETTSILIFGKLENNGRKTSERKLADGSKVIFIYFQPSRLIKGDIARFNSRSITINRSVFLRLFILFIVTSFDIYCRVGI